MEKTIRTIRKSQRGQICVGLSEFAKDGTTFNMVFARAYFDDGAEYRPGRNGINVRVELLPELIAHEPRRTRRVKEARRWPSRAGTRA